MAPAAELGQASGRCSRFRSWKPRAIILRFFHSEYLKGSGPEFPRRRFRFRFANVKRLPVWVYRRIRTHHVRRKDGGKKVPNCFPSPKKLEVETKRDHVRRKDGGKKVPNCFPSPKKLELCNGCLRVPFPNAGGWSKIMVPSGWRKVREKMPPQSVEGKKYENSMRIESMGSSNQSTLGPYRKTLSERSIDYSGESQEEKLVEVPTSEECEGTSSIQPNPVPPTSPNQPYEEASQESSWEQENTKEILHDEAHLEKKKKPNSEKRIRRVWRKLCGQINVTFNIIGSRAHGTSISMEARNFINTQSDEIQVDETQFKKKPYSSRRIRRMWRKLGKQIKVPFNITRRSGLITRIVVSAPASQKYERDESKPTAKNQRIVEERPSHSQNQPQLSEDNLTTIISDDGEESGTVMSTVVSDPRETEEELIEETPTNYVPHAPDAPEASGKFLKSVASESRRAQEEVTEEGFTNFAGDAQEIVELKSQKQKSLTESNSRKGSEFLLPEVTTGAQQLHSVGKSTSLKDQDQDPDHESKNAEDKVPEIQKLSSFKRIQTLFRTLEKTGSSSTTTNTSKVFSKKGISSDSCMSSGKDPEFQVKSTPYRISSDAQALGFSDFDQEFDPKRFLCTFSSVLPVEDSTVDSSEEGIELFFFHVRGMAAIVGVGLPFCRVLLRADSTVEVREMEEKDWKEIWRHNSRVPARRPLLLFEFRSKQDPATNTASSSIAPSFPVRKSSTPLLTAERELSIFGLADDDASDVEHRNTEGSTRESGSPARSSTWITSLLEILRGEKDGIKLAVELSSSLKGGAKRSEVDGSEEPSKVKSLADGVRIQSDRNWSSNNLGSLTFYNSAGEFNTSDNPMYAMDEELESRGVRNSTAQVSNQTRVRVRVILHPKGSSLHRKEYCENFITSPGPIVSYPQGSKAETKHVIAKDLGDDLWTGDFTMEPILNLTFTSSSVFWEGGLDCEQQQNKLEVSLKVRYNIDKKSNTNDPYKFGWYHDDLKLSFRCKQLEVEDRKGESVGAEPSPNSPARSSHQQSVLAMDSQKSFAWGLKFGYTAVGALQFGSHNSKGDESTIYDENGRSHDHTMPTYSKPHNFCLRSLGDDHSLAYMASSIPPINPSSLFTDPARKLASSRGLMSSVDIALRGTWNVCDPVPVQEHASFPYELSCQRDLIRHTLDFPGPHSEDDSEAQPSEQEPTHGSSYIDLKSEGSANLSPKNGKRTPDEQKTALYQVFLQQILTKGFLVNHTFPSELGEFGKPQRMVSPREGIGLHSHVHGE